MQAKIVTVKKDLVEEAFEALPEGADAGVEDVVYERAIMELVERRGFRHIVSGDEDSSFDSGVAVGVTAASLGTNVVLYRLVPDDIVWCMAARDEDDAKAVIEAAFKKAAAETPR